VNLITAHEATRYPNLQAVNLGCGGATTASMADGPGCSYTFGTQLGDAVAILRAHPRQVAFVTIDIGADEVAACQSPSGPDAGTGHTTSLTIGGQWWMSELGPFLWDQLRLSTAAH